MNAKPFLKWAGGKTQLIGDIENGLPEKFVSKKFTYIEPFVGSGALVKGGNLENNFFYNNYEEFNINRVFARKSTNAISDKFNMGVSQKGQAFRSNLLLFKAKCKRISSTILNAKLSA